METGKININTCTRQQILQVLREAKARKTAWEERVQKEMKERQVARRELQESHYYDIQPID